MLTLERLATGMSESAETHVVKSDPTRVDVSACDHATPLKVIIVGTGPGGLSAALSLRRNGHRVELYEQSRLANETGAAIHLSPNANGVLRGWGIFAETFGAVEIRRLQERNASGHMLKDVETSAMMKQWPHPWLFSHRVSLHERLKALATSQEGLGPPAKLHTASKVVGVDAKRGRVELADGRRVEGDVVIGADGIYSTTRAAIKELPLLPTGKAAFRFLIPRRRGLDDPLTRALTETAGTLAIWFGDDRRVVVYPCNDDELLNFVCIHPDTESHATKTDGWSKRGELSQVLKVYREFDPALLALITKADPGTIKVWQLQDMEKLPAWVSAKLALMGDAAHPFTPHQGQGAGQAIEDAAALSIVLPTGTAPSEVPDRLKLYETIRYERAHTIQEFSRQAGRDWEDGKPTVQMTAYMSYNFGHDEVVNSTNELRRWKRSQQHGSDHAQTTTTRAQCGEVDGHP